MPTLQWLDDEQARRTVEKVPYRMLQPDDALSCGDSAAGNMLIQGDNLDALKSLMPYFAGRVRCVFIDPPYNTGSAFEHYDDNIEHSTWLSLMYPRLELLRDLLAEDGSIWVSIDDNEAHYLKVIMDEVFGRKNFVANVLWQKRTSSDARLNLGAAHDHVLVYGKQGERTHLLFNKIGLTEEQAVKYSNPDNDPRGSWTSTDFTAQGYRPNQMYEITTPGGAKYLPPPNRCWANVEPVFKSLLAEGRLWFGKTGKSRPRSKTYLTETSGVSSWTWWTNKEVGHNQESKKEINALFGVDAFGTPKPERLLKQIITIATNPGDLVLDSFMGSGTTAAVAHKMGRRWIGIEMGEHAVTHCAPRLRKVVEGEQGGISKAVGWKGGGGFRFYRLGEAVFDAYGAINPAISYRALAAHVWFAETGTPDCGDGKSPLLGVHNGTAYYLLYNGILGDKRTAGGNVLNSSVFNGLPPFDGPKVIYGEWCQWGADRLKREKVAFKQTPYDIRVR